LSAAIGEFGVGSGMDLAIEIMHSKPRLDLEQELRVERAAFAAKVRAARAVLGLRVRPGTSSWITEFSQHEAD
jgi:hypothetical protein